MADDEARNFRTDYGAAFKPSPGTLQNSTLQQRVWEKRARSGSDLLWPGNEPLIYVLVTGKEKFKHPDLRVPQKYALAITFFYDADTDIRLYQKLRDGVKVKVRERIRARTQIKM